MFNHHGTDISVIFGRTECNQMLININTAFVALFKICFQSLVFDIEKARQNSEFTAITRELAALFKNSCF